MFQKGDYPPVDISALRKALPSFAWLVIGDVKDTVPAALDEIDENAPIGYISFDLDYYSSTVDALAILSGEPRKHLPVFWAYFDDVSGRWFNDWCGELLAIREFNESHRFRKLHHDQFLKTRRFFKNAEWIDMMRSVHVLDHPSRSTVASSRPSKVIGNAALGIKGTAP